MYATPSSADPHRCVYRVDPVGAVEPEALNSSPSRLHILFSRKSSQAVSSLDSPRGTRLPFAASLFSDVANVRKHLLAEQFLFVSSSGSSEPGVWNDRSTMPQPIVRGPALIARKLIQRPVDIGRPPPPRRLRCADRVPTARRRPRLSAGTPPAANIVPAPAVPFPRSRRSGCWRGRGAADARRFCAVQRRALVVEPEILKTVAVVDAVGHDHHALQPRLPAMCRAACPA